MTPELPLDFSPTPVTEAEVDVEVESLYARQETERGVMEKRGYNSGRINFVLGRKFGREITGLASRGSDVDKLLQPEAVLEATESVLVSGLQKWGQERYAEHGSDDARSRQLPSGDR